MTVGNRALRFEAEFECVCGSLIQVKTFRAIVEGPGQFLRCSACHVVYRLFREMKYGVCLSEGAEILGKNAPAEGLYPGPISSYGIDPMPSVEPKF